MFQVSPEHDAAVADLPAEDVFAGRWRGETAVAEGCGFEAVEPAGVDFEAVGGDQVGFDAGYEGGGEAGDGREEGGCRVAVLVAETEGVEGGEEDGVGVEGEEERDLRDGEGPEEVWGGVL